MPLSAPAEREPLHRRRVECRGYRRRDGLWDIEGHLVDTKDYAFDNEHRGRIQPGEALHRMAIRLTVDDRLTIRRVEAVTDDGPYRICGAVTPALAVLEGERIGPGFRRTVAQKLGGRHGCTHLVELLGPVATAAFQTIYPVLARERGEVPGREPQGDRPPPLLNSCHVYADDGELVRRDWPRFYQGPAPAGEAGSDRT